MKWVPHVLRIVVALTLSTAAALPPASGLQNGSFEVDADGDGVPDAWAVAGSDRVRQELRLIEEDGVPTARLQCTEFTGGNPSDHVMLCQTGTVGVRKAGWYRLRCLARGEGIPRRRVQVALRNTRTWQDCGITGSFSVSTSWRPTELVFRATDDVSPESSRLQFWFAGTGTLFLRDVAFEAIDDIPVEFNPAIDPGPGSNAVPNASFECGSAGWGGFSPDIRTWGGNVFEFLGEIVRAPTPAGTHCLKLRHDPAAEPVFHFDYFDPVRQPVRRLVAGNRGWLRVRPGEPYTLSCIARAEGPRVDVLLVVQEAEGRLTARRFPAPARWETVSMTLKPERTFLWVGAGIAPADDAEEPSTLFVDAVALAPGTVPPPFAPRDLLESFLEPPESGMVLSAKAESPVLRVRSANAGSEPRDLRGTVRVTDFSDREISRATVSMTVPPAGDAVRTIPLETGERTGFFRAEWIPESAPSPYPQSIRLAVIPEYGHPNSPFGMNHAYPWPFLLDAARRAGITRMRDWSVKWHTVEPKPGSFDFSDTDPHVDRVIAAATDPLLLLPFASTPRNSAADPNAVEQEAGNDDYLRKRLRVACPPTDRNEFAAYARAAATHYRDRVDAYEILNEPLYTTYAVPARFGYGIDDYLELVRGAAREIRAVDPGATVVGGIGAWVDNAWVTRFIEGGGTRVADVMDIHLYPETVPPELYEADLQAAVAAMRRAGALRPMWLTEFGCYADDDPHRTPGQIGDSAMSRSNWGSERAAAEAMVKSAAVFLANGVERIYFHAGTCGALNGSSGGGIFFEYGGAPRKMLPALAVLADLLGPAPKPLVLPPIAGLRLHAFAAARGAVAVAWVPDDGPSQEGTVKGITVLDLMGNRDDAAPTVRMTNTPIYLIAESAQKLENALREADLAPK